MSGHPVFLTFDNLLNLIQNLPEAKILLGFLPKVQDTSIRNMLKADDVIATYKGAKCKMPCYSCMVLQSNLNNINLGLEDMTPRTHKNMQQIARFLDKPGLGIYATNLCIALSIYADFLTKSNCYIGNTNFQQLICTVF
ncbi:hypothetical protein C1646_671287 [Rhizophagus diaphanus]|nr:hypothetical protein C1646_671287 [Rhizophagus diaphanus] [Rhizophagus sp. MUCL 43196]